LLFEQYSQKSSQSLNLIVLSISFDNHWENDL
jgi:hypothetical protein